jgi:4'-phosphopantetheinyl transferase
MAHDPTVDLWWAPIHPRGDPALEERLCAHLAPEDLARLARGASAGERTLRLAAWALARHALSHRAGLPPHAWRFTAGPRGRPEIAGPAGAAPLRFNLSHTNGLVTCAVALEDDVGVDVEHVGRRADTMRLARRCFAPSEVAALAAIADEGARRRAFFARWTLKEAYLKARGSGLSLPLAQVAFACPPGRPPRADFGPALHDDPSAWQFALVEPTPGYVAAVAIHRRASTPAPIVLRRWEPS